MSTELTKEESDELTTLIQKLALGMYRIGGTDAETFYEIHRCMNIGLYKAQLDFAFSNDNKEQIYEVKQ